MVSLGATGGWSREKPSRLTILPFSQDAGEISPRPDANSEGRGKSRTKRPFGARRQGQTREGDKRGDGADHRRARDARTASSIIASSRFAGTFLAFALI